MTEHNDLFDEANNGDRPKQKRKKPTELTPTMRAEYAFKAEFEEAHPGVPLIFRFGRDRKLLKTLVEAAGEDLVVGWLIPEFFRTRDPEVTRLDYTVPALARVAQRLLLRRGKRGDVHPRTAENIYEAQKAMGRKP